MPCVDCGNAEQVLASKFGRKASMLSKSSAHMCICWRMTEERWVWLVEVEPARNEALNVRKLAETIHLVNEKQGAISGGVVCYMVENAIKANAARWVGDNLHVEMMNGRTIIVPRWLLPELKGMVEAQLEEIEIIDGGRGILFGDIEGLSMQRLLGIMTDVKENQWKN